MRSLVSVACIATEQIGQAFGGTRGLSCCSTQPMTAPNDFCGYDLDQKSRVVGLFGLHLTVSHLSANPPRNVAVGSSLRSFSASGPTLVCFSVASSDQKWCVAANDAKCRSATLPARFEYDLVVTRSAVSLLGLHLASAAAIKSRVYPALQ